MCHFRDKTFIWFAGTRAIKKKKEPLRELLLMTRRADSFPRNVKSDINAGLHLVRTLLHGTDETRTKGSLHQYYEGELKKCSRPDGNL